MEVEIREATPRKAVCMGHRGPYPAIGETCGRFFTWVRETGTPIQEAICLYYDNPREVPEAELRSEAGAFVPPGYATSDPRVHVVDVAGGPYAVGTHVGSYARLGEAWGEIMGRWLPQSGRSARCAPSFEIYLNDCSVTPEAELTTELWVPVEA